MRRILSLILAVILIFSSFSISAFAEEGNTDLTSRKDFLWGVNGHDKDYPAYPEEKLEDQIKLAAELGSKIYRTGYNPDFRYMNEVVKTCEEYGMKVMLVIGNSILGKPETSPEICKLVAEHFNGKSGYGKIDYFQIGNECSIPMLKSKWGGSAPDGSEINHYLDDDLNESYKNFKACLDAFKSADSDAKTVINFSYLHYGWLKYLYQKGLRWDILGVDWYSSMEDVSRILPDLLATFPMDVIFCESNIDDNHTGSLDNDVSNYTWLLQYMNDAYKYDRVKGFIFYELLDELDKNNSNREAHFGLVKCSSIGEIGEKKPIYNEIQKMLNGGPVTKIKVDHSDQIKNKSNEDSSISQATSEITEDITSSADDEVDILDETTEEVSKPKTAVKRIVENVTKYYTSWLFIVISTIILLAITGGGVFLYFFLKKKKLKKS